MNWIEIGREESRQKYEDYCATGNLGFSKDYDELRKDLVDLFQLLSSKLGLQRTRYPRKIIRISLTYNLDSSYIRYSMRNTG